MLVIGAGRQSKSQFRRKINLVKSGDDFCLANSKHATATRQYCLQLSQNHSYDQDMLSQSQIMAHLDCQLKTTEVTLQTKRNEQSYLNWVLLGTLPLQQCEEVISLTKEETHRQVKILVRLKGSNDSFSEDGKSGEGTMRNDTREATKDALPN